MNSTSGDCWGNGTELARLGVDLMSTLYWGGKPAGGKENVTTHGEKGKAAV